MGLKAIKNMLKEKFSVPLVRFFSKFSPEKTAIIWVDGGFCSVVTKYAIGKCIEKKLGMKVKYDLTWFKTCGMDCDNKYKRSFELLNVFPDLDFEIATDEEISFFRKYFYFKNEYPFIYCDELFSEKRNMYVDGGFDHWRYWEFIREELLQSLDFESLKLNEANQKVLEQIKDEEEPVAVHVRRGDYVNLDFFHKLPPEYFVLAINHIKEKLAPKKPHFFFFSNGMDWVKEKIVTQLPEDISYTFVEVNDNDTGYFDLYLISKCKHQIASNSAFGYWGGVFNKYKDKIVIIPEKCLVTDDKLIENIDEARNVPGWLVMSDDGKIVND